VDLPYTQWASTMTHLNYLDTEFVHVRLLQGNSQQYDENLVKQFFYGRHHDVLVEYLKITKTL